MTDIAKTADYVVIGFYLKRMDHPNPLYYIGGQADLLSSWAEEQNTSLFISFASKDDADKMQNRTFPHIPTIAVPITM